MSRPMCVPWNPVFGSYVGAGGSFGSLRAGADFRDWLLGGVGGDAVGSEPDIGIRLGYSNVGRLQATGAGGFEARRDCSERTCVGYRFAFRVARIEGGLAPDESTGAREVVRLHGVAL